jgi:hypothetical protein
MTNSAPYLAPSPANYSARPRWGAHVQSIQDANLLRVVRLRAKLIEPIPFGVLLNQGVGSVEQCAPRRGTH